MMKSVYVVMHQRKPNTRELLLQIVQSFHSAGISVHAEPWLYFLTWKAGPIPFDGSDVSACDAIVSVGGDGTLLRANAIGIERGLPVLGINVGRVGFLTEVEPDRLDEACDLLRRDAYTIETRMMLEVSCGEQTALALNDVVISRGGYSRLIGIEAWVEGDSIGHYIADGVIVSTPTGSTGYSLSAGGPIVYPEVECMIVTPICAHSLQHRPVVTAPSQCVTLRLDDGDVKAMVSVDGRDTLTLAPGQKLTVKRAESPARFIRLMPKDFFGKIRIKLSEWSC